MSNFIELIAYTAAETEALAASFSKLLVRGDLIGMYGELGAGKTTFMRGLGRGLGMADSEIHSPTFALMNQYGGSRDCEVPVYHFDLYRIQHAAELIDLCFDDYVAGSGDVEKGIVVVEWAERLATVAPKWNFEIHLTYSDSSRKIRFSTSAERAKQLEAWYKRLKRGLKS
jgi:tRNA threonylcarbamoyladenosine biosynthesis protein TsaE